MATCTRPAPMWMAVGLAGLAACSGGTGPADAPAFDAVRVEAGVLAVERVSSTPVVTSFMALGSRLAGTGAAAAPGSGLLGAVRRIAAVALPGGPALVPVIRSSALGATWVYDAEARTYAIDPARTGAPADGVRFLLYETDPATQDPLPGREIGYADLRDSQAGSPTAAGLTLDVVAGGVTHLHYRFDLSGSIVSATVRVDGFLSDGTERVNFEITTEGQLFGRGGPVTLRATLAVPSQDFTVEAALAGVAGETDGDGRVDLTVASGTDQIVVKATTNAGQLEATFTVNGTLLARATGDPAEPVIRGGGGRELTSDEQHALVAIVGLAGGIFEVLAGLLQPVGALLLLALAL